mgnify:CR=1 FL=1
MQKQGYNSTFNYTRGLHIDMAKTKVALNSYSTKGKVIQVINGLQKDDKSKNNKPNINHVNKLISRKAQTFIVDNTFTNDVTKNNLHNYSLHGYKYSSSQHLFKSNRNLYYEKNVQNKIVDPRARNHLTQNRNAFLVINFIIIRDQAPIM